MHRPTIIVVCGIPGAGKTTLIRRAADRQAWTVLDTADHRARLPRALRRHPLPVLVHYAAILAAIARRRPAIVHSRGTKTPPRRLIATLARARGYRTVLVLLDAPRVAAEAGQLARGRTVPRRAMDREAAGWERVLADARAGRLGREGWTDVAVLDRAAASAVARLDPAHLPVGPPAARRRPPRRPRLGSPGASPA